MSRTEDEYKSGKVKALRKVNEAVSDYLLGLRNNKFAKHFGGIECLLHDMTMAHEYYENNFNSYSEEDE